MKDLIKKDTLMDMRDLTTVVKNIREEQNDIKDEISNTRKADSGIKKSMEKYRRK